jgi:hypothetical protein
VTLADASEHRRPAVGVSTVAGRGHSASEVAAELMDVLADDPRVVECDLAGVAAEETAIADAFETVNRYLSRWPGPVVMVHAPDPALRAGLRSLDLADRMRIHTSWDAAVEQHLVLPHLRRHRCRLPAHPAAAREARSLLTGLLADWQLPQLTEPAGQVVSELVNAAAMETATALDLTVSKVDERLRIAVREDGLPPAGLDGVSASPLHDVGLQLVEAFARSWDVIPARSGGRTTCAVLDTSTASAPAGAVDDHARADAHGSAESRTGRRLRDVVPVWPRTTKTGSG